jgi:hypothetical protein
MTPDKRIVLSRGHSAGNVPQNQSIWRFMQNALDTGRCPGSDSLLAGYNRSPAAGKSRRCCLIERADINFAT